MTGSGPTPQMRSNLTEVLVLRAPALGDFAGSDRTAGQGRERPSRTSRRAGRVAKAAMFLLATWGLHSCGDPATEPPTPWEPEPVRCAQGEFKLTYSSGSDRCTAIPVASISYIDSKGNPSDQSTGITNHTIRISFDSRVSYLDGNVAGDLSPDVLSNMLEINNSGGANLLDVGIAYEMQAGLTADFESYFTFTLVGEYVGYHAGTYSVVVKNYALAVDTESVLSSTNTPEYLNAATSEFTFTAAKLDTPCTREDDDYFALEYGSSGIHGCIAIPGFSYSFTPSEGVRQSGPNGDPTVTVDIEFDSEVSFLNDSGNSRDITKTDILDMVEIRPEGTDNDLVRSGGPIDEDQVSLSSNDIGNTVISIEPPGGAEYSPGDYTVLINSYARKDDAPWIAQSGGIGTYLDMARGEFTFTTVSREELCREESAGYFRLTNADGTSECIKLPGVRYTFTQWGGLESALPTGNPATTIRIRFGSEVLFLDDDGSPQEITKEDILDMVELMFATERGHILRSSEPPDYGTDLVSLGGLIGPDRVSVTTEGGKTVLAIEPPGKGYYPWTAVPLGEPPYTVRYALSTKNYVKKDDAVKIAQSGSVSEYLAAVSASYEDDYYNFFTDNWGVSCDIQSSASTRYRPPVVSGFNEPQLQPSDMDIDHYSGDHLAAASHLTEKADPNKTYIIDVAFVLSDSEIVDKFKAVLKRYYFPNVNSIYQNSGVDVRFRVAGVVRFSDYKQHLLCPVDELDGLVSDDGLDIARELGPRIRREHNADLVYALHEWHERSAGVTRSGTRLASDAPHHAAYRTAIATVEGNVVGAGANDIADTFWFTQNLAHALGHNLGLWHDKDNVLGSYPVENIVHASGYGYGGTTDGGLKYGTIMSAGAFERGAALPFLSTDGSFWRSELCSDETRYDNMSGSGFCPTYSSRPDEKIRLGGMTADNVVVDAVEALQYSIVDASRYSSMR